MPLTPDPMDDGLYIILKVTILTLTTSLIGFRYGYYKGLREATVWEKKVNLNK